MAKKQKLELTWVGKDERPKLEPRILIEDPEKSYHAKVRYSDDDNFDNILIKGDNLLALRALEQEYAGKISCIYIDPPYNTGSAFEHYDDGLEHSIWLGLMKDRLKILKTLLSDDGFICCHIDDSEGHYLKVLMDEVFGRENYQTTFYIQVRYAGKTLKQDMNFHKQVEMIHIYRGAYGATPNLNKKKASFEKFKFYIEEKASGTPIRLGGKDTVIFQPEEYEIVKGEGSEDGRKEIWATGSILDGNSSGRFFRDNLAGRFKQDGYKVLYKVKGIGDDKFEHRYFTGPKRVGATKGKYYQGVPISQLEDREAFKTTPIENFYDLAGAFGNCRLEGDADFRSGKKPEALLQIILKHFSKPGDIVLDSFGGSGSTAAAAHKLRRKWITVEIGQQADLHIRPRLKKVISGDDQTGITKQADWKGGGGFRYYSLAPSLLETDKFGNWVISKDYNPAMLSEAMCKHMGFTYAPSHDADEYWKHGYSTESDFIYVTTQNLTHDACKKLADEVGKGRSLLICCKAYSANAESFDNLTLVKIPTAILAKCEWGQDDYSLNVENLPMADALDEDDDLPLFPEDSDNA
ncbi:site-specific DNA-methyltransferase [uncultured Algimonas sp.]|uniref:site-specific DNA-methyltransferase n=1 Tax=uncultured Algimonas sp. TaxID=1547920 RepID=UPI002637C587|nr:site-specific DNA-methyltransferase [uncultured Algimonas sp.]